MPKVLVTGSAGFIGMHTAIKLRNDGYDVVGLDNINDYYDVQVKYARLERQGFQKDHIEYGVKTGSNDSGYFIKMNLEDRENLFRLFQEEKFDYVVNLAAQAGVRYSLINPYAYVDSNITGFLNILEACRAYPVKHVVYASSSSVYGLNKDIPFNESRPADHPVSLYAASKKANEMMAHTYAHLFRLPSSGLRFFTVYGPWGRPDMALFIFTKNIIDNKPIEVFNHGAMMRDFTYVEDIVKGVAGLLDKPPVADEKYDFDHPVSSGSSAPYAIYNIGAGSPVNLMDFIHAIEKKLDKKAEIIYKPMQPGDVPKTYADTALLERVAGYKPETKIQDGVNRFIDWYREYYG